MLLNNKPTSFVKVAWKGAIESPLILLTIVKNLSSRVLFFIPQNKFKLYLVLYLYYAEGMYFTMITYFKYWNLRCLLMAKIDHNQHHMEITRSQLDPYPFGVVILTDMRVSNPLINCSQKWDFLWSSFNLECRKEKT